MSEAPDLDALSFKGRSGLTRILNATGYSLAGLRAAYRGEAAFRQLVWLNLVLLPLACLLDVSRVERVLLMLTPLLALVVELLNSAIEAVVDRISLNLHPLSKQAKDMGSAAQLLALLIIALTWALILL
ncbi:Diacylglycerol kinase [Pseudomonas sp. THAF187a]|uniref:Diacylglycerol kinase n=1 Tax=Ectopseudomonas khazarica TaxID=2502979 RepID=A0ABW7M992_9GAMM|nr:MULTISPECIES: diacylglycerol kinase [unclassified Pseudomonas]QFT22115.1 Diacylglycerol kinase [Pseudomonas sp. THAF187a]QFT42302.1 Diacylglycerol kinase [Pseudomonas sp. THAF42]TNF08809.1 MAG: diacylglycerol kinase [Pseudomonadales bacterium]WFC62393.1 diacylglycerol kinase [Pseudomonas sp. REST10]|tara:strand:+ start:9133 stop:9519 length:387 start_codon:yes stop_codon:yes gene_type:complete